MDLKEARRVINGIDDQIVALFVQRMETVEGVAEYKRRAGLPVLDSAREAAVLDRVAAQAGPWGEEARALFERIMALSRARQEKLMEDAKGE